MAIVVGVLLLADNQTAGAGFLTVDRQAAAVGNVDAAEIGQGLVVLQDQTNVAVDLNTGVHKVV